MFNELGFNFYEYIQVPGWKNIKKINASEQEVRNNDFIKGNEL